MKTASFDRRYAMRKVIIRAQVGFAVLFVLAWALLITERAGLVFIAIGVLATAAEVWQGVDVVRNGGVRETPVGITNRRVFGYQRWPWEEIDSFKHVRSRVYLVTRDGRLCPLTGVNEGWRNSWDGGETREITALLNDRLSTWQAEQSA